MKFTKWLIILILIVSFIFVIKMQNGTSGSVEGKALSFSLEDIDGNILSLDKQDSNVILFFWATWCPYCRNKIPKLNEAYPKMQASEIELWAINVGESKSRAEGFAKKHSVQFPVLLDHKQQVAGKYKVLGLPTFILINKDKNIIFRGYDLPGNYLDIFSNNQ